MILTTSFKFNNNNFFKQIDFAKEYKFKSVIYKEDYKTLISFNMDELKEMYEYAKANKIEVIAIDTKIKAFKLKDADSIKAHLNKYVELIKVAKELRVKNLFMTIPKIAEIVVEHDDIKEALMPLHDLIVKEKINISIKPSNVYNVYAYIFHQRDFKNFSFYFDVVKMYQYKSSLTTSYRLLKDFTKFVVINDVNKKKRPVLAPHGLTKIEELLEAMRNDNYKEYGILDEELLKNILETRKKPLWTKISKKWFKKGDLQDQVIASTSSIINPNEEDLLGCDVVDYQIDYLNNYFRTQKW